MESRFHIYDTGIIQKEFIYFFGTHFEEIDPYDKNGYVCGILITRDYEQIQIKIPYFVFISIPKKMKRSPTVGNYHMFKFDKSGIMITNIDK